MTRKRGTAVADFLHWEDSGREEPCYACRLARVWLKECGRRIAGGLDNRQFVRHGPF